MSSVIKYAGSRYTSGLSAGVTVSRPSGVLPDNGDFDAPGATDWWVEVQSNQIAVYVGYTADPGATNGKPAYRLAWRVPIGGASEVVYQPIELTAVTPDGADGPVTRLRLRKECGDLLDGDGAWGFDAFDVPPGANAVRVEMAEVGDVNNPGTAVAWIGGA